MKNETMKFIDSCVGNIARKIEDEFNENDHPRDKGGKFTSKGSEGKGGESEPDTAKTFHSAKQVGEEVKKDLREKYAKAHGGEQLPETDIEKAAKEELSEHERKLEAIKKDDEEFNKMSNELLDIASDLDTANDALRVLGWDNDYDDLEQAHEALKEAIRRDPEKAKELLENTPGRGEEDSDNPVSKVRKHLEDELFEASNSSESEEEFISKAERTIKSYLWAAKHAPGELPVKGQKAEYALKKILSEIKSGTSEYW